MNPITIAINDTRYYNETLTYVPRLYELSKKLAFFVRYLNANFDGLFINGGVSSITTSGNGCFFLVNGVPLSSGNSLGEEISVSVADRNFLYNENFDENMFNSYALNFVNQLQGVNLLVKRRIL